MTESTSRKPLDFPHPESGPLIAVRLTDAKNGYQLWAQPYDREVSDVFSIQEEIAQNIFDILELTDRACPAPTTGP